MKNVQLGLTGSEKKKSLINKILQIITSEVLYGKDKKIF